MGLNCKPDDLAIIVKSNKPCNVGIIVRVGRAWAPGAKGGKFGGFPFQGNLPAWVVRSEGRPIITPYAGKEVLFYERPWADAALRPIRPGDLTQEEVDALYKPEVIKQRDPEAA